MDFIVSLRYNDGILDTEKEEGADHIMQKFTILNQKEIASVLDMNLVIEAVEQAYAFKCSSRAQLFPLVCHSFQDGEAEFDIKSGTADGAGIFGMKLVSAFAGNDQFGLPRLTGTILVFDRQTGMLQSMMDGGLITNMRTGAAGAVGCKYLARPESEVLLLVGTGAQGPVLLDATLRVMKHLKKILVCNPKSPEKVQAFIEDIKKSLRPDLPVEEAADLESAVRTADIILTATPARSGLIQKDWVKPGTHLSCIGSDMEGKQELALNLTAAAKVFCDDLHQVVAVGECEKAVKEGLLRQDDITEIGDVILGSTRGRTGMEEITIFDSTGIGLQDLMVAAEVTRLAQIHHLGTVMEL